MKEQFLKLVRDIHDRTPLEIACDAMLEEGISEENVEIFKEAWDWDAYATQSLRALNAIFGEQEVAEVIEWSLNDKEGVCPLTDKQRLSWIDAISVFGQRYTISVAEVAWDE